MSTNGCVGICIDSETHLMHVCWDSYPAGLGRRLVRQIQAADIDHWEEAARSLNATEHLCGPDFRLTEDEIRHIISWVAHSVYVQTSIEPEDDDPSDRCISVCHADQGLFDSGAELADVLEPTLRHDPAKFFNAIAGRLNATLELGLFRPLSARFLRTPLCEWVYLIDFDEGVFIVGGPHYDATEWLNNRNIDVWAESDDDMIEYREYAKFPLNNIPDDWEDQVERVSAEDQDDYPQDDPQFDPLPLLTMPIIKPEPKSGPNEPCPCGSGRKHKKCCGRRPALNPLATLVAPASASILRSSSLDAVASHQRPAEDDWAKRSSHCGELPSPPQTAGA